jgi:hypothetical protein
MDSSQSTTNARASKTSGAGSTRCLVQLLLPLYDRGGKPQPPQLFAQVEDELADRFGGSTFYVRGVARGKWRSEDGNLEHDEVIVGEVITHELDRGWWKQYQSELARRFGQDELLVRASTIELL